MQFYIRNIAVSLYFLKSGEKPAFSRSIAQFLFQNIFAAFSAVF